jgi:hypothetical protein
MALWNLVNKIGNLFTKVKVEALTKQEALTYSRELYDCDDVDLDRGEVKLNDTEKAKVRFWE